MTITALVSVLALLGCAKDAAPPQTTEATPSAADTAPQLAAGPSADTVWAAPELPPVDPQPPAVGEGPKVELTSPLGGWSSERVMTVAGTIADTSLDRATLVVNGAPKGLSVSGGSFSTPVVLGPGLNTVEVVARNADGVGRRAVSVYNQVPPKDLTIVLTWDTDGTDIDLHVVDPTGRETYFGNRQTETGATLDQDVTTGYGPETFTMANAIDGTYEVRAKYYSDNGKPQTFVRVDVILYEGTDREERLTYRGVLEKTGEVVHVASFSLPR